MAQRLEPLHDFCLIDVEPPKPYHEQEGFTHLVLPEKYEHGPKDRVVIGKVLKKGPTCSNGEVQTGMRVILPKWRGAYLNPTRTLLMIREDEILAVDT